MLATTEAMNEESQAVFATAERFCARAVAPLVERPEKILGQAQMAVLAHEAREAGLLPTPGEEGIALWESAGDPARFQLTLQLLQTVAAHNAGVALHLHALALGAWIAKEMGTTGADAPVPLLGAESAGGKGALARFLAERPLDDEGRALLNECFASPGRQVTLQAADPWDAVVVPTLSEGQLQWSAYTREAVSAAMLPNAHGLNELVVSALTLPREADFKSTLDGEAAKQLFVLAAGMHAAALTAIAVGSVRAAVDKATRYAIERRQGGKKIAQHAAMRMLFGDAAAVRDGIEAALGALSPARDLAALERILAVRAMAHPLLCAAANEALQIFGGYGYMKDYGMEKIVRDNNQLRLTFGTPTELRLWLAESEVAHVA